MEYKILQVHSNYTIEQRISSGSIGIRCNTCKYISFNPNDIEHKYCDHCHKFH